MAAFRDQVSSLALVLCVWEWTQRKTQLSCIVALPVKPVRVQGELSGGAMSPSPSL